MRNEIGGALWFSKEYLEAIRNKYDKVDNIDELLEEFYTSLGLDDSDVRLLYTGRTAIDCVLEDITSYREIKLVYMPSYLCSSMIQPIIDRGIKIKYYSVEFDHELKVDIDVSTECDVFFTMEYFGYQNQGQIEFTKKFLDKGVIVIEDCTHRYMSDVIRSPYGQYQIISLHKWLTLPMGGLAIKRNGEFKEYKTIHPNQAEITQFYESLMMKYDYLNGKDVDKDRFLRIMGDYYNQFFESYTHIGVDNITKYILIEDDRDMMRRRIAENGSYIHSRLKLQKHIEAMFDYQPSDYLLFIPICVESKFRQELQQYLISKQIYLPIHWPHNQQPKYILGESNCYDLELSLICDWRYNIKELKRMMDEIEVFVDQLVKS